MRSRHSAGSGASERHRRMESTELYDDQDHRRLGARKSRGRRCGSAKTSTWSAADFDAADFVVRKLGVRAGRDLRRGFRAIRLRPPTGRRRRSRAAQSWCREIDLLDPLIAGRRARCRPRPWRPRPGTTRSAATPRIFCGLIVLLHAENARKPGAGVIYGQGDADGTPGMTPACHPFGAAALVVQDAAGDRRGRGDRGSEGPRHARLLAIASGDVHVRERLAGGL